MFNKYTHSNKQRQIYPIDLIIKIAIPKIIFFFASPTKVFNRLKAIRPNPAQLPASILWRLRTINTDVTLRSLHSKFSKTRFFQQVWFFPKKPFCRGRYQQSLKLLRANILEGKKVVEVFSHLQICINIFIVNFQSSEFYRRFGFVRKSLFVGLSPSKKVIEP